MNDLYYMGLVNCNECERNCCDDYYTPINYPEYEYERVNKSVFTNENEGFLKGNIEKDTYKPYKNYMPGNVSANNDRDRVLLDVQMYGFYLIDLGLYLDTHPNDERALRLFNETREKYYKRVADFERMYYPLSAFHSNKNNTYEWLEGKFPFVRGN